MNAYQQRIELPRAIATSDGHPVKGELYQGVLRNVMSMHPLQ